MRQKAINFTSQEKEARKISLNNSRRFWKKTVKDKQIRVSGDVHQELGITSRRKKMKMGELADGLLRKVLNLNEK